MNTIQKYVATAFSVLVVLGLALCQLAAKPAALQAQAIQSPGPAKVSDNSNAYNDAFKGYGNDPTVDYHGLDMKTRQKITDMVSDGLRFKHYTDAQYRYILSNACAFYCKVVEELSSVAAPKLQEMLRNGATESEIEHFREQYCIKTTPILYNAVAEVIRDEANRL